MRSRRTPRLALAAGLCAAGVAHPLRAQRVRVTVVEAATRAPALGVVVSLTDPANHRVVSGLTDAQGSVVLAPPAAGRFAVRAERVGADPWTSGAPVPLTPARSDTLAVSAALTARTTRLHATVVRADRRCDRLGEADGSAASVWQAASAALAATALSEREGRVRTRLRLYERELTAGGRVEAERLTGQGLGTGRPFTTRTPAQLGGDGYVRPAGAGAEYFGPDAAALLSSEFAATHCVRLVRGAGAEAGLVGLAFDVVPGRTQPDIAGTLWVDEATAALRHVAYRYVQRLGPRGSSSPAARVDSHAAAPPCRPVSRAVRTASRKVIVPRRALLLTLLAATSAPPAKVAAQAVEAAPIGADVRVRALPETAWRRGELLALDRERLVLGRYDFGWRARPDTFALVRVERVEVRRPTPDRTARVVGGGFLGGLVGVLAGGFVGYHATTCGGCEDSGLGAAIGAPLGGLVGLVVGAGVARARAHYWEPISLLGGSTR